MRAVPGPDATERWGVPIEPAGVPQAPIRGLTLTPTLTLTRARTRTRTLTLTLTRLPSED